MLENLPEEQMKIRNRLRDRIARQPTVEGQVESWESILTTFFEVFDGLIGNLAARAVLSRSIAMASRDYPRLAAFTMTDHGPDTSRLLESLADEPVTRLDGDGLEIVAPKPMPGSCHEAGALGFPDEEHGSVGGQKPRDPVHGECEYLAGLEPRRRDGEDLLADRESLAVLCALGWGALGRRALGGRDARRGR